MHIDLFHMAMAMVNFALLLVVLRVFLYKPVFQMLEARKAEINDNLDDAAKAKEDALALKAQYDASLKEANKEAQSIIAEASQLGEKTRGEMIAKAKEDADRVTERAKAEINREKNQALKDLREEVANLAMDAAAKVVRHEVTPQDHRVMIEEFLAKVGESK